MSFATGRLESDTRAPLSAYAKSAIAAIVGVTIGLAATWFATGRDFVFGAAKSGPWIAWPKTGAQDADPYARAIIARQAEAPLGNGEGILFVAREDSEGRPLDGSCEYALEGQMPVARLWTLALYTPQGRMLGAVEGHREITSADILRSSRGESAMAVAPSVRAGNWLATARGKPFALALTLYDASASPTQTSLEGLSLPGIRRGECL